MGENEELELVATTDQVLGTWTQIILWHATMRAITSECGSWYERRWESGWEKGQRLPRNIIIQSIRRLYILLLSVSPCVYFVIRTAFFLSGFCFMSIFDYMFVLLLNWTTVIIDNDVAQCVMLPSTRIKIFLRSFVCSFVDAAFHSIPFRSVLFAYDVMSKMSAYYLLFFDIFFCSKRKNFCILLCAWISSHPIHRA